jgi:hypothetical protein
MHAAIVTRTGRPALGLQFAVYSLEPEPDSGCGSELETLNLASLPFDIFIKPIEITA